MTTNVFNLHNSTTSTNYYSGSMSNSEFLKILKIYEKYNTIYPKTVPKKKELLDDDECI